MGQYVQNPDGTHSQQTVLTGRNVQEIIFHNAVAITTISNINSLTIDVSMLSGRKYVHVYNGLDQSIAVSLFAYPKSAGQGISQAAKSVAAATVGTITDTDFSLLKDPVQRLMIRIATTVAPTTGSVSVWLEGVQQ